MRHVYVASLAAVLFACCWTTASAQDGSRPQRSHDVFVQWENDTWTKPIFGSGDAFERSDDGYTNGVRIEWLKDECKPPFWLRWLGLGVEEGTYSYRNGYAIGQNMYTPRDKQEKQFIATDRPYGGWLYGGGVFQAIHRENKWMHTLGIDLGVTGTWSGAAETQTLVHEIVDSPVARGWGHQVEENYGVVVRPQTMYRPFDPKQDRLVQAS